jgi:universal stress protein A
MDNFSRILVISKSTKHCEKAIHYGLSLAKKYGAELYVMHVIHNPFGLEGWPIAIPSLKTMEEEYKRMQENAKADLDKIVSSEKEKGMPIYVLINEGDPEEEIYRVVKERQIDLLIMLSHEEGRVEHFLFGRGRDGLIRKMPCSIMLIKQEPKPAP